MISIEAAKKIINSLPGESVIVNCYSPETLVAFSDGFTTADFIDSLEYIEEANLERDLAFESSDLDSRIKETKRYMKRFKKALNALKKEI
jgi:putative intracellular protease/amidase